MPRTLEGGEHLGLSRTFFLLLLYLPERGNYANIPRTITSIQ